MISNTTNKSIGHYPHSFRISNFRFGICLVFSILILGFLLLPFSASAALILQAPKYIGLNSGLVGYWSFNAPDMAGVTAYDRSGNSNNGTLTNGPVRAIGKLGQALSFDGSNDYVNVTSFTNMPTVQGAKTLSVWAYWPTAPSSARQIINYEADASNGVHFGFHTLTGCSGNSFGVWDAGGPWMICTAQPSAATWHHLVYTWDGTTHIIYVDRIQQTTSTTAGNSGSVTKVEIGAAPSYSEYFAGLIDDVRVYNRALTGDEIKRLYRIGATLKVNTSINNDSLAKGLVGYWSFNGPDIAGTTAYDRSGQGKNGSSLGQDISSSGLVGWWKLDGASSGSIANGTTVGFEDSSGSSKNGTASNSNGTGMAWTTPKIGVGATSFDGTDDFVTTGNTGEGTATITVALWVYKNVGSRFDGMVNHTNGTSATDGWWFTMMNDVSPARVNFSHADNDFFSTITFATGEWNHIVAVYNDSANTVTYYKNGGSADTVTDNFSITGSTANLRIGLEGSFYGNQYCNCLIDDVRVYNRAISAAEVAQLYAYGLPKFASAIGKIGQGIDSTLSYVNPGNVSSSVNSFAFWVKTASSSPTINLLDLNAGQYINIVGGTVKANGITSPSIFVDGVSGSTVNAGWHHITVTTGTAVNASAVNLGLNATTTAPLDGALDDIRFYNRVINGDEIKRLYRIGATLKVNTDVSRDNPDLERGLVGLWSFDGKDMANVTAYDRSGNSNNGTLTNGPTRAIGKLGQALSFDGDSGYVDIGTGPTSVNAVSFWVYPKTTTEYFLNLTSTTDYVWVNAGTVTATGLTSPTIYVDGVVSSTLSANKWQHVVVVTSTSENASNLDIGRTQDANYIEGLIDDVRVYNRALSADEIKRLYNLGR